MTTTSEALSRYEQVAAMTRRGMSVREIADALGIGQRTVSTARKVMGVTDQAKRNALSTQEARERYERIGEMARQGKTNSQIATALGVTNRTVTRARRHTKTSGPRGNPMTEQELERARQMLEEGCSYGEVCRTLGRQYSTIWKRCKGMSQWKSGHSSDIRRMFEKLDKL